MTSSPTVVYMVPSDRPHIYAMAMDNLTTRVQNDLRWKEGSIDLIGLIAATAEHGTEGVFFLEEMGVNTRAITLLVLWGETAEALSFSDRVSEECGVGTVVLPETGVVIPVMRVPSIDSEWWRSPMNAAHAASVYTSLVENGRVKRVDGPTVFVACPNAWN